MSCGAYHLVDDRSGSPHAKVMYMTSLRPVVTALLLVCVLMAPVAAMDVVLCIGADGHVTLEAASNGRCSDAAVPTSAARRPQTTVTRASADHCGPCLDVPLSTDATKEQLSSALHTFPQLDAPGLALVTCLLSISLDLSTIPLGPCALPTVSTTLRAIRTVVLLL